MRARQALEIDGDYGQCLVFAYSASEALFDALLLLMCWEAQESPQEVAQWFDTDNLAKRLRTHYGTRIGGNWDTTALRTAVGRWHEQVAKPRHLTVHAGHRPTLREARDALTAMDDAVAFAKARLLTHRNQYKRTTLLLLGKEALVRRDQFRGQIRRFFEQEMTHESDWVEAFNSWVAALPRRFT